MRIAVLPFSAHEGTKPALGRQFAVFAGDQIRAATETEVNNVSYLGQQDSGDGVQRMGFINLGDSMLADEQIGDLAKQADVQLVMDGTIKQEDDNFDMRLRFHHIGEETRVVDEQYQFTKPEIFQYLHKLVKRLASEAGLELPETLSDESMEFGTDDPEAFLEFLLGYDAFTYIQQAEGRVVREFSPEPALQSLVSAVEADPDFLAPYEVCVELCRACAHYRLGSFEMLRDALTKLTQLVPDEYRAWFGLGEIHGVVNDHGKAADYYEKAANLKPEESALWTKLGLAQLSAGMPVNAERNLRKALDLEGDDKPSSDFLAMVLQQTNRAHEVPPIWKAVIDKNPQNAAAHGKYAVSLVQAGRTEEGEKAFENALETLEDNTVVKRFYAPYLASKEEYDRAMDFYEDCLDASPADIQTLLEYANTLKSAGREFEIPKVLKDVLQANPDPNTRAQTLAWLIELEQPKRVESVQHAEAKMNEGDFASAVRELKPLRNWLADYWKLWALLSAAHNRLGESEEAEQAAKRLLELFPGCEPGYGELVNALSALDRNDEAYQIMRFAASNMPSALGIHINLALAAKRAGHTEEARSLARRIREAIGPNQDLEPVLSEIEA
ncbi:MAG TPA: tetratricopeptide repeat protein [Fimbriimonadaceae bacterium]|nr:tetratricopeptide repeat protein [Fimbriimonadaceae bacterium]